MPIEKIIIEKTDEQIKSGLETAIVREADIKRIEGLDAALTASEKTTAEFVGKMADLSGIGSSALQIDNSVNEYTQTAVLLGDSLTAANYQNDGTYLEYRSGGYFTWLQCLSGHAFNVLKFAGISGQTSTQILARVDTDVIPYKPEWCFILAGMNDSSTLEGDATLISNLTQMYNKCNTAGIKVVMLTMTSTASSSAKNAQAIKINSWMMDYFKNKPNIFIVDSASATRNPASETGALKSDVSWDGIHNSNNGAYLIGKKVYETISKYIKVNYKYLPKSAYDAFELNSKSLNYFKFPMFSGTVTSGRHERVLNPSLTNATCTLSVEPSSDGLGNCQVYSITATQAAVVHSANAISDINSSYKPVTGEKFYITCEITIDEGAVNFAVCSLAVNIDYTAIKGYDLRNVNTPIHALTIPSGGLKLNLRTPVVTVGADSTNSLYARLYILFAGAGNAVVRLGKLGIVKMVE